MGECCKMDIMKLNGYTIKAIKHFYVAIDDNHKRIIRYDKDINNLIRIITQITNKERE